MQTTFFTYSAVILVLLALSSPVMSSVPQNGALTSANPDLYPITLKFFALDNQPQQDVMVLIKDSQDRVVVKGASQAQQLSTRLAPGTYTVESYSDIYKNSAEIEVPASASSYDITLSESDIPNFEKLRDEGIVVNMFFAG